MTDVDRYAELLHITYEAAAHGYGWKTQEASNKPWADVPEANRKATRAALASVLAQHRADVLREAADRFLPYRCEESLAFQVSDVLNDMADEVEFTPAGSTGVDNPTGDPTELITEDEEPVEQVVAAFAAGEKRRTTPPRGVNVTITAPHPAEAAVERVRALHRRFFPYGLNSTFACCSECTWTSSAGQEYEDWPCATIRALDGES